MNNTTRRGPEGLRVYWLALDFLAAIDRLLQRVPVKGTLGDQLRRAAESIVLNIAEGAAHTRGKRVQHYEIAHASVHECIAALHAFAQRYPRLTIKLELRMANMLSVMQVALLKTERGRDDSPSPHPP